MNISLRTRPLSTRPLARKGTNAPAPALPRPNTVPATTHSLLDATIDWGLYRDGVRATGVNFAEAIEACRANDGFCWVGLHEPNAAQLTELGEHFGIHELTLEDVANPRQRPKLERYEDITVMALRTLTYRGQSIRSRLARTPEDARSDGGDIVETGSIMVIVGANFVVTVRHGQHASMAGIRRRLQANPSQLALGPSAILHAVSDKVVDDYLAVVDAVQDDIEDIEEGVFAPGVGIEVERIYQLKRDVIEMKRTVEPLGPALRDLAERPRTGIHTEIREYFRDVADHHARVREQVASFDELLTSILQAALARISIAENEDMRRISAWVAIAAVPTMIAGIFGMNFAHIPGTSHPSSFGVLLSVMVAACGALYVGFKRNSWL